MRRLTLTGLDLLAVQIAGRRRARRCYRGWRKDTPSLAQAILPSLLFVAATAKGHDLSAKSSRPGRRQPAGTARRGQRTPSLPWIAPTIWSSGRQLELQFATHFLG